MKKILKNRVFLVIITAIIFTGVGIYAETKINASEIKYIDKDNNETTVDAVLDDLYDLSNNYDLTFYEPSSWMGARTASKSITKKIQKGKSLLFVAESAGAGNTSISNTEITYMNFTISNDNSECQLIANKGYRATASATNTSGGSNYNQQYTVIAIYYCNASQDRNITILANDGLTTSNSNTKSLIAHTVKLR